MNHSAFFAKGAGKAPAESFCLERKSDQRMFRELFDKKKERDNLERYDDKRRNDNRGNRDGNGEGDDNRGSSGKGPNRQNLMIMLLATVIALVVISYVMNMGSESATRISYNEFLQLVNENKVEEVNMRSDRLDPLYRCHRREHGADAAAS